MSAWGDDYYWPKESDSKEVLEAKVDRNTKAAWGDIVVDAILPDRESDVTEYQSNAWVAKEYLERKKDE